MAKNGKEQFCVIGLGSYGTSLAKSLSELGAYVMAVDHNIERVEEVQQFVSEAIMFDATDPAMLAEHGVYGADVVIVGIGEAFEPVVLICMELLKAGVPRIIARAGSDTQQSILNRIGIKEVIHPERDEGARMATQLMHSSVSNYFELSEDIAIYEIDAPKSMHDFTLAELKLRERYEVNLLTIKRPRKRKVTLEEGVEHEELEVLGVLDGQAVIRPNDRLVVMGRHENIKKLMDTNQ
ncbi:potassium channel family protein [Fodinibius sediminis]|uniref:Trk system potassium uptake protein TrkA n=1 Tax=Fodinibius sediminis TaxID=1214077 RepID=A0A521E4T5_9BACT|nr:TrkA family potassium uptake protein [Fodinibius sediminis]SMO78180.1 trk system potassium uptake protein TrkA [Fodinibius sediminis]